jgi:hypothetical protein
MPAAVSAIFGAGVQTAMEEIEVPTEHLHEAVHEEAHHSHEKWVTAVALSTAILAALAAIAALLAGKDANEAVIGRGTASDTWSQFATNSIKLSNLEAHIDLLKFDNKPVPDRFREKIDKYTKEKNRLQEQARTEVKAYQQRLARHEILAHGVTMFQIAIAVSAIAALTKRRWFWYLGLAFGAAGIGFLVYALAFMPVTELKEEEAEPAAAGEKTSESKKGKEETAMDDREAPIQLQISKAGVASSTPLATGYSLPLELAPADAKPRDHVSVPRPGLWPLTSGPFPA